MDPYEKLKVSKNATDTEIKKAYRKLAAKHHPDKGGDESIFKQINEAYSTIESHEKRQEHEASQNLGNFGEVFGNFGDIFEGFFGNRSNSHNQPREQTDDELIFDLKISLAQIKKGFSQNVVFSRNRKCHKCHGQGGENKKQCLICNGHGVQAFRLGPLIQQTTCRTCFGRGYAFEEECSLCQGQGLFQIRENINFTIKS